jgi:hypothetical protein
MEFKVGREHIYKITKLSECENPDYKAAENKPDADTYNKSLHVGYNIIGFLSHLPEVDESTYVTRLEKNGIKMPGFLTTSIVKEIKGNRLITCNSIYEFEELPEYRIDDEKDNN